MSDAAIPVHQLDRCLEIFNQYFGGIDGFIHTYNEFEQGKFPAPPRVPRHTDPESSTIGVVRAVSVAAAVLEAARQLPAPFTDDDLRNQMQFATSYNWDRGIVARARFDLEKRGKVARIDQDAEHIEVLRFEITPAGWAIT